MELTRERKTILIAGAILLACALLYRFAPAISDAFSVGEEAEVMQAQIRNYQSVIAKQEGLQKEIRNLRDRLQSIEKRLLPGSTASLAAVNLQEFIKKVADAEDIEVDSMRVMSARQEEGARFTLVPVRFVINSNARQLKDLLFQIESGPRLLIVRDLRVDSRAERTPGELRSILTVEGVMPRNGG